MTTKPRFNVPPRSFIGARSKFTDRSGSPRAFLERCLERISAAEDQVKAFTHLDIPRARIAADQSAERWSAGRPLSPIDGMPVGIKDVIETDDMPTQMGSPLFEGWQSRHDAASVIALRNAGAIVLGKTVTTEFAATVPGPTRNPWDLERTPGGSSSGSAAAVAAGMVSAALGTQVVGSVIRPASYCGCFGFKPTVGALNRGGSHDHLSQSCTGVLAATLEDGCAVLSEIARRVGGDPGHPPLRLGQQNAAPQKPHTLVILETAGWPALDDAARSAFESALGTLRANGIDIRTRRDCTSLDHVESELLDAMDLTRSINAWESLWPLGAYRRSNEHGLSKVMRDRLAAAEAMSCEDYMALLERREAVRRLYAKLAHDCDAVIAPAATGPAPMGLNWTGDPVFAVPASLLGVPAISLPVLSVGGLPLGFQVIGFAGADARVIETARALQAILTAERRVQAVAGA